MTKRVDLLTLAPLADFVYVLRDGSFQLMAIDNFSTQMAASGAIAGAMSEIRGQVVSGLLAPADWADLLTLSGTVDGAGAEVLATDEGTHNAATATGYNGAAEANAGRYRWNDTWQRWVRIGDVASVQAAQHQSAPTVEAIAPQFVAAAMLSGYTAPTGFGWGNDLLPLLVGKVGSDYRVISSPREMVDPTIWEGPVIHVDRGTGNDANSGLGEFYGDFSNAKQRIHAAFTAGNATGGPYVVLVNAGEFSENDFTSNGNVEPTQNVALVAYGGRVKYRTGPWSPDWSVVSGTTYHCPTTSVSRVFRTDVLDSGLYVELQSVPDLVTCDATVNSFFYVGAGGTYVNIGGDPDGNIALIRGVQGANFTSHTGDFYIEGFDIEGGLLGALHFDPEADRNIVGVDCTFRYSAPSVSNPNNQLDAVRIRRTNGVVYFQNCDASAAAKDGWNFHEDSYPQMQVLLENCTSARNGWGGETSVNAMTTHDGVIAAVVGGSFSGNGAGASGSTVHCIQAAQTWLLGVDVVDADADGNGVASAVKCSTSANIWLEETTASATGGSTNTAIEANGGAVHTRNHTSIGAELTSSGGSITAF